MAILYQCGNLQRLTLLKEHLTLNGIEYLEVLDSQTVAPWKQRTLLVRLVKPVVGLDGENIQIDGGVRVTPIMVQWAFAVPAIPAALLDPVEAPFFAGIMDAANVLAVRVVEAGDHSDYTLKLRSGPVSDVPPPDFDPLLSEVVFNFKAECPTGFDCAPITDCPAPVYTAPALDYLSRDYASFRRLLFDRLAVTLPDWTERHPADIGTVLVELLAHAADQASYYQDAVATEAYLGTARQRISVKRHARLLDYRLHEGVNARTWVGVQATADGVQIEPGLQFFTRVNSAQAVVAAGSREYQAALAQNPVVFEAMHEQLVYRAHNELTFYTFGDDECCLAQGAVSASLRDDGPTRLLLRTGDVLLFEEVKGPVTGLLADADPVKRHAVRLSKVTPEAQPAGTGLVPAPSQLDPLTGVAFVRVEWFREDALPFSLCVSAKVNGASVACSVARGNIVLADHGRTVSGEDLVPGEVPLTGKYRPRLQGAPLTRAVAYKEATRGGMDGLAGQAAAQALLQTAGQAIAAVQLREGDDVWSVEPDLLSSTQFTRGFVEETDDRGVSFLRFGDGRLGMQPAGGSVLQATYRVGNGIAGNIGRDALAHVVTALAGIASVRNPLPATGGTEPETTTEAKLYAPQAFRTQLRMVTEQDHADFAGQHPEVQKAVATRRWTGSWHTVFVTVDRKAGQAVDDPFRASLRQYLEPYRIAGVGLEIDAPRFVPLEIVLTVCVKAGYFADEVRQDLLRTFTPVAGRAAFFSPDQLTFGQPVFLSAIIARIMQHAGVAWVDTDDAPPRPNRFRRWGEASRGELQAGVVQFARLEIARVDNNPDAAENGRIDFVMQGGR